MSDLDKQPARIAGMFDAIAGRYDTLNHLLSAGLDRGWRRRAVRALALSGRDRVLDVCTGTCDLAIEAVAGGARDVVGVDFASEMLRLGRDKIRAAALTARIHLARGDAMRLPFRDATFDAVMVAFGIRNVLDPVRACAEIRRVLRPGGRAAILEFGVPTTPGVRQVYGWYFRAVLPRIGRLISRHGEAYSYLPASVVRFPSGAAMADLLRQAGFPAVTHRSLTGGVVSLYVATNAPAGGAPATETP
jgi:demethylmenaquinone methyltransferase/2-methoxy-6-polyprenyl-1,4-benzoquinol methylase